MKVIKWLILVALLVVGLCSAVAWYTGMRLQSELEASVGAFNGYLYDLLPSAKLKVELLHVERDLLRTQVQYQMHHADGEPPLLGHATLEHGPFPWSRLQQGHWLPVLASGTLVLQSADGVHPELQGDFQYDYRQQLRGEWRLEPQSLALADGLQMQSDALSLSVALNAHAGRLKLAVSTPTLRFYNPLDANLLQVTLTDPDWLLDRQWYEDDLYVGDSRVRMKSLALKSGALQLNTQGGMFTDQLQLENGLLQAKFDYQLEQMMYAGRPLGDVNLTWQLSQLNPKALQNLVRVYEQPAAAEQPNLAASLGLLLANKPELRIDELRLSSANGVLRLTAQALFNNPQTLSQPLEQLLPNLVRQMDLQLSMDKALVSDLLLNHYFQKPNTDALALQQAQQMSEGIAQTLTGMSAALAEGERLVASLDYRAGAFSFNGHPVSMQELSALLSAGQLASPATPAP